RINRRYAWERAVILSPQPKTAREQLLAKLKANIPGRPPGEAEAAIDKTIYFPAKRSVFDKSIRFFVPKEFIGDSDGEDWALTAFVTMAAPIEDDDNLGVRQPQKEVASDALAYSNREKAPPPVIDVLLTSADLQYRLLAANRALVGSSWGPNAIDESELDESVETVASRLQQLKDMVDRGLIDEAEYSAQREKVLAEL
ncbi:MAG: SHOCT domain-containing protein, partial [Rhodocyclales bacterium]|nr:SHOCT domain-containing protein [Rhodocyclales bacterium]